MYKCYVKRIRRKRVLSGSESEGDKSDKKVASGDESAEEGGGKRLLSII